MRSIKPALLVSALLVSACGSGTSEIPGIGETNPQVPSVTSSTVPTVSTQVPVSNEIVDVTTLQSIVATDESELEIVLIQEPVIAAAIETEAVGSDSELIDILHETYSVVLDCASCKISEVTLNWEVHSENIETVELFHVVQDDRVRITTLGSSDSSNNVIVSNVTDYSQTGGACFDVVVTYLDGSSTTIEQSCLEMI